MVTVAGHPGLHFSPDATSYPVPQAIIDALLETIWSLPNLRVGFARFVSPKRLSYIACAGPEDMPELTSRTINFADAPGCLEALQFAEQAVDFEDIVVDWRTRGLSEELERLQCRSMLALPLRKKPTSALAGLVTLDAATPRTWGQKERHGLERLIPLMDIALENAILLEELHRMRTQFQDAERKLGAIRAVATSVIHDTALLTQGLMSEIARAHRYLTGPGAEEIRQSASALSHQIECVLSELMAAEHGSTRTLDAVDVSRVITELAPALRVLAGPQVRLLTRVPAEALVIPGHERGLERMLLNLVVHARNAARGGEAIVIEARREDDDVVISVRGDALGVDAALMRLQGGRGAFEADDLGLGLWFTRCEILLHEARLEVTSDGSGQPRIELYFPAVRA